MINQLPTIPTLGSHVVEIHYKRPIVSSLHVVCEPKIAVDLLRSHIDPKRLDLKEFMWGMFLSSNNGLLAISEIGSGSVRSVIVNSAEIFQIALSLNASGIVLIHNHTSGNLKPSSQDITATQNVKKACKLFEMCLLDHLIITSESFYSMANEGLV